MRFIISSGLVVMSLFAVASNADADCLTVKPTASITLDKDVTGPVFKTSGTSYLDKGCGKYVVKVSVKSDADEVNASMFDPKIWLITTDATLFIHNGWGGRYANISLEKAECKTFTQSFEVHKKASGESSFTEIASWTEKGEWEPAAGGAPGYCRVMTDGTRLGAFDAPASGTDVYRVVASSKVSGKARKVTVALGHGYIGPG